VGRCCYDPPREEKCRWRRSGAAIEIAHLSKLYGFGPGALTALDDINLWGEPGEFLCIVGPSGCRKSTLLRIPAGLDHPVWRLAS
jgi:NitT/TauT family transport system ATP-binding protein